MLGDIPRYLVHSKFKFHSLEISGIKTNIFDLLLVELVKSEDIEL